MNIFFDVDHTIISWDVKLRPGVKEVFQKLRDEGHILYLWSGMGPRWEVVKRFDLHEHIVDCFWKPLYDHTSRLEELGVTLSPDYVIDDHAEVVEAFVGTVIKSPCMPIEWDTEMWRVYEDIQAFVNAQGGLEAGTSARE